MRQLRRADVMKEKIVGILGGVGPEATVDIFKKVLKSTPAKG